MMRCFAKLQGVARRDFAQPARRGLDVAWLQVRAAESCFSFALAPVLAWMRPFGVDEQSFIVRMGYWSTLLVVWFALVAGARLALAERRGFEAPRPVRREVAAVLLAAVPMVVIAGAATHALTGWQATLPEVLEMYLQILVLGGTALLLSRLLTLGPQPATAAPGPPPPAALAPPSPVVPALPAPRLVPPLVERLPPELRGPLVCLQMEDHYVRVHTMRGSALLLMRLTDAIAGTQPVAGRQVHRSWWVSDQAVEAYERAGRVGVLLLSNGCRVPVSQRYLAEVEAAFGPPGA